MQEIWNALCTHQQLIQRGLSPSALSRLSQRGVIHPVRKGIFVPANFWEESSAKTRYAIQIGAASLACERAVVSHESAALWLGCPLLQIPAKVHLSQAQRVGSRRGITNHLCSDEVLRASIWHDDLRVTHPVQTLVDCARTMSLESALCVADSLLHRQLCSMDSAVAALNLVSGRGKLKALDVSRRMSPFAESPAETLTRNLFITWGAIMPEEQSTLHMQSGHIYRPDFLWRELKIIVEVDGEHKYSGVFGDPNEVIRAEHRRRHELEMEGWTVIRVRWRDIRGNSRNFQERLRQAGIIPPPLPFKSAHYTPKTGETRSVSNRPSPGMAQCPQPTKWSGGCRHRGRERNTNHR